MELSSELVSQFAKVTKDQDKVKNETTVYGTLVEYNGAQYVKLDGSELLTPVSTTATAIDGERVTVSIKNHTAIVTGNISSPSARNKSVEELGNKITEFEIVIANKVSVDQLEAEAARIDTLVTENLAVKERLEASEADIGDLQADNVDIKDRLTAGEADIETLKTNKLDAEIADIKYASVEDLSATNANIHNLEVTFGDFKVLNAENLDAINADIDDLQAKKLDASEAEIKYANIDFTNIGKAAMEYFYANSGLIRDVVVDNGTITGNLVGVTISGDLIEGNTIVAEKLVIKGTDGLYYKLNTDGISTESEQTDYNSLNGNVIKAKSITASKIRVSDLVAFDATIGGFNITSNAIYSGVKESVDNTTRGIYLDNDGQIAIGDSNNYIKYYRDSDGTYKLAISARSISMSTSNKTVEESISEIQQSVSDMKDDVATVLRIESSRGTVFKNNQVSTVLSAVIYRGSKRITDITTLKEEYGDSAYLEWYWQRMEESSFGAILPTDSRLGNDGFTFTLSSEDVDTKVTFMCRLITD